MADYTDVEGVGITVVEVPLLDSLYFGRILPEAVSGAVTYYKNAIFDPGGPDWVMWTTTSPDTAGASYPDPYGTGFGGCSGYRVVAVYTS